MNSRTADISADPPCHLCGYDLRAHPPDGKCPECGASVAESRKLAAIPSRPAWRDSDPRWRRRMLAGMWILALLPLMDVLQTFGWASSMPVPGVFEFRGTGRTLDQTLLCWMGMYPPLVFCIGVVLLFSKEQRRRPAKLDWTRRWGVLCSYVVFLLSAAEVLFLVAIGSAGVAWIFLSMPVKYQPHVTQLLVDVSAAYFRYGASPRYKISYFVSMAFSSTTILLACVPLWDALRSTGPKRLAAIFLAPLALLALVYIVLAGCWCLGLSRMSSADFTVFGVFFCPHDLVGGVADLPFYYANGHAPPGEFFAEATKWCIVLAIAIWLTIAQLAARRERKKAIAA